MAKTKAGNDAARAQRKLATKITAKKCKDKSKMPRKQLKKPTTQPTPSNSKTKTTKKQNNTETNKKIAAEKRENKEKSLKETLKQQRLQKLQLFKVVISAYLLGTSKLGLLGTPHEYMLPPAILKENREIEDEERNYLGKNGPKIRKYMGECGLCLREFRDITRFRNHMPYHDGKHLYICMFCVLSGRKLINCFFITEDNLMNHTLRYHYTGLSVMEKGELKNTNKENTPELQKQLAKLMRVAYEVQDQWGIKFH